jgi:hypothetical protein
MRLYHKTVQGLAAGVLKNSFLHRIWIPKILIEDSWRVEEFA